MAGKVGHPKRPRSEAATFGRLVEAERAAGARTLGLAMTKVRRRDAARWGSKRKMEMLWAEFKEIKRQEAATARLTEALAAQLAAFERATAEQFKKVQAQVDAIEADFVRRNPAITHRRNRLRKPTE